MPDGGTGFWARRPHSNPSIPIPRAVRSVYDRSLMQEQGARSCYAVIRLIAHHYPKVRPSCADCWLW